MRELKIYIQNTKSSCITLRYALEVYQKLITLGNRINGVTVNNLMLIIL